VTPTRRIRLVLALGAAMATAFPAHSAGDDVAGAYLAARQAARDNDYAAAGTYYAQALVQDPSNQAFMEGAIFGLLASGRLEDGIPVARRLVSSGGRAQPALIVLLADQVKRGDFGQALDDLEAGRNIGPLLDGLTRAWGALGDGRMSEALEAFDVLAEAPGMQPFGHYHKAVALAAVGDFEGADALFSEYDDGFVRTRRGAFAHAQILSQLERNEDALARLEDLFGSDTDPELDHLRGLLEAGGGVPFDIARDAAEGMAEAFFTIAAALQGEAADNQTLLYARTAAWLRPGHADAVLLAAGMLEAQGQHELAGAAYATIPEDSPSHLAAAQGRAQSMFAAGHKDEAVALMQALSEHYPDMLSVHVGLGDFQRQTERYEEAAAAYSRAIALIDTPENRHWPLFYSRAIAWERAKMWDEAEPDFRKALELNPEQPSVLNYLGYSLLDMNRNLDEAMGMIERAVAQRPDDGYITDSLAWGYFMLGRYDEAVEPMEKAAQLLPVDPIVTDHLGDVYWAVGRILEARFQWKRALSFEPEPDEAVRIRRKLEVGLDRVLEEEGESALSERGQ